MLSRAFKVERIPAGPVPFQIRDSGGAPVAAINEFLAHLATRGLSGYTLRSYAVGLGHFFGWLAERETDVDGVTRYVVGEYIASFGGRPKIRPATQTGVSNRGVEANGEYFPAGRQARTINHRLSVLASYSHT